MNGSVMVTCRVRVYVSVYVYVLCGVDVVRVSVVCGRESSSAGVAPIIVQLGVARRKKLLAGRMQHSGPASSEQAVERVDRGCTR